MVANNGFPEQANDRDDCTLCVAISKRALIKDLTSPSIHPHPPVIEILITALHSKYHHNCFTEQSIQQILLSPAISKVYISSFD